MPTPASLKQKIGAVIYDVPRFCMALEASPANRAMAPWIFMRNRREQLERGPGGEGARCLWQWTSQLHVADVFPRSGRLLMARCFRDWPLAMDGDREAAVSDPRVSFLIGHRGLSRLPHLLQALTSIGGQSGVPLECIVVEQSSEPEIQAALPAWVRYVYTRPPDDGMPYSRAWAFNVAARAARGELLIFHDNDMLVPRDYAAEMVRRYQDGSEIINLKRFIFYLDEARTHSIFDSAEKILGATPDYVVQNLEAGGSIGCARSAFFELGGWDEAFVGWGGEDNEFWERAETRKVWVYGYLPIVHLWHTPQAEKWAAARPGSALYQQRHLIDPQERIAELRTKNFGGDAALDAPSPRTGIA